MTRARTRLLVLTTATGAGMVAGAALAGRGLLQRQAAAARRVIGKPLGEEAIDADRVWKKKYGDPIDLLLLGDSVAAGLGAERPKETLGGRLARCGCGRRRGSARSPRCWPTSSRDSRRRTAPTSR